jgi:hypothetical protein
MSTIFGMVQIEDSVASAIDDEDEDDLEPQLHTSATGKTVEGNM